MKQLFLFFLALTLACNAHDIFVSPKGDDLALGTREFPLATLRGARDFIRRERATLEPKGDGIVVWLGEGLYRQSSSFELDGRDSGTDNEPIIFRALPGERVSVTGGRSIEGSWFSPMQPETPGWSRVPTDSRSKVMVLNLKKKGVINYGTLRDRGFFQPDNSPMELFVDGEPLFLARWPNRGEPLARTGKVYSGEKFFFTEDRIKKWATASDVWLHGFFGTTWADYLLKVDSINADSRTVLLASAPFEFGIAPNRLFYGYNILEELDQPGEYYIDRLQGILYCWPTRSLDGADIQLSDTDETLLKINGARHVTFRDITFENSRGSLVAIYAGENVQFEHCLFRNAGQTGAMIDGFRCGLNHCEIVDCGELAVQIKGGNRSQLVAGENYLRNSCVRRSGRLVWSYPAVRLAGGCGNFVSHNLIEDVPDSAVRFSGNNHTIDFNEMRRACHATSDAGVIYGGKDWGLRGNSIRNNFIHSSMGGFQEGNGVYGIYIDDCGSGVEISKNVIFAIETIGIAIRGGRDNIIKNNIIAGCEIAHSNSNSGRTYINNLLGDAYNLLERLKDDQIDYQAEPWKTAYPKCAAIPNDWKVLRDSSWLYPEGCVFDRNAGWDNRQWTFALDLSESGVFERYASINGNDPKILPLIFDKSVNSRASRSLVLNPKVEGFEPIDFRAIGPEMGNEVASSDEAFEVNAKVDRTYQDGAALTWRYDKPLLRSSVVAVEVEARPESGESWRTCSQFTDADTSGRVYGLLPNSNYKFRLRVSTKSRVSYSNEVEGRTQKAFKLWGLPKRFEVEENFKKLVDEGAKPGVGVSKSPLSSEGYVRMYSVGDAIEVPINLSRKGLYRILLRTVCGNRINPSAAWPAGYELSLGGSSVRLTGTRETMSKIDTYLGGAYWGTLRSEPLELDAGTFSLKITSRFSFGAVDYVEFHILTEQNADNLGY